MGADRTDLGRRQGQGPQWSAHMKTTLETSGEDVKTTLKTSGEDVKTTLETSGENVKITLETSGEHSETTLETSGEDSETTLETSWEHSEAKLETSGGDFETTLETSGEDVKTTLETSGEDFQPSVVIFQDIQDFFTKLVPLDILERTFDEKLNGQLKSFHTKNGSSMVKTTLVSSVFYNLLHSFRAWFIIFPTRFECSF